MQSFNTKKHHSVTRFTLQFSIFHSGLIGRREIMFVSQILHVQQAESFGILQAPVFTNSYTSQFRTMFAE